MLNNDIDRCRLIHPPMSYLHPNFFEYDMETRKINITVGFCIPTIQLADREVTILWDSSHFYDKHSDDFNLNADLPHSSKKERDLYIEFLELYERKMYGRFRLNDVENERLYDLVLKLSQTKFFISRIDTIHYDNSDWVQEIEGINDYEDMKEQYEQACSERRNNFWRE